jgi:hypothetical protein
MAQQPSNAYAARRCRHAGAQQAASSATTCSSITKGYTGELPVQLGTLNTVGSLSGLACLRFDPTTTQLTNGDCSDADGIAFYAISQGNYELAPLDSSYSVRVSPELDGLYLDSKPPARGSDCSRLFVFDDVSLEVGTFRLRHAASGRCLAVATDGAVELKACDSQGNEWVAAWLAAGAMPGCVACGAAVCKASCGIVPCCIHAGCPSSIIQQARAQAWAPARAQFQNRHSTHC